jgi:hypothetical protein
LASRGGARRTRARKMSENESGHERTAVKGEKKSNNSKSPLYSYSCPEAPALGTSLVVQLIG